MIRTPSKTGRSRYQPMWQDLPRSLNVHYHWFELEGSDKPKRALFAGVSWIARKVLYYGTNAALIGTILSGLLTWGEHLSSDVPLALGVLTAILALLSTAQEVVSALVRGREFRFDGSSADHGFQRGGPIKVQVIPN